MPLKTDSGRTLLTTREAGEISGFTHTHMSDLARQGRIEAIRMAHVWMIYEDTLRAYLAQPHNSGRPKKRASSP
jgi:hypothetical protein